MTDKQQIEAIKGKNAFIIDMDTDIVAGIESDIDTVLVLTGITSQEIIDTFPYRPEGCLC